MRRTNSFLMNTMIQLCHFTRCTFKHLFFAPHQGPLLSLEVTESPYLAV